jgi:hypothetical protein
MRKDQMELSLQATSSFRPAMRGARRPRRAHWWFQRMRQIVERALDREPAPQPKSEQIYLSLPGRQVACEAALEKGRLN